MLVCIQTTIRLLPIQEVTKVNTADVDLALYTAQMNLTQINVALAFDSYRELKNDLERVHVYSSDNPTDSSADKQAGFKVIVIDAPFPPTLKISGLGIGMTDSQLLER